MKRNEYQKLDRPLKLYMLVRNNEVTGWSPDKKFARSCRGKNERVIEVNERS